jgi:hypothetical protein
MSPKPDNKLISLKTCAPSLATHYPWEKETLVDYIAESIGHLDHLILEGAKAGRGITHPDHYREICAIASALRSQRSAGMDAKIELKERFCDIRDFVVWTKEELADYLIHQIIATNLESTLKERQQKIDEVHSIAFAIYEHQDIEGYRRATEEAEILESLKKSQTPVTARGSAHDAAHVGLKAGVGRRRVA